MGLPPTRVLLAAPRRSKDPLEWSREQEDRDCLKDWNPPGRRPTPRALSPLKVERRHASNLQPMCVLPRYRRVAPNGEENVYTKPSCVPIPLSARELRRLSVQKAEEQRTERLGHEESGRTPRLQQIVMPQGTYANQQTRARPRRHTVDGLSPIDPTLLSVQAQRPRSAEVTSPTIKQAVTRGLRSEQ